MRKLATLPHNYAELGFLEPYRPLANVTMTWRPTQFPSTETVSILQFTLLGSGARDNFEHHPKRVDVSLCRGAKRPVADDPSLAEAVDALKKGQNVRLPGLLDERIEDCGPNRNCFAAVKRERNASKPPLEEFLSRFLGS